MKRFLQRTMGRCRFAGEMGDLDKKACSMVSIGVFSGSRHINVLASKFYGFISNHSYFCCNRNSTPQKSLVTAKGSISFTSYIDFFTWRNAGEYAP